MFVFYDTLVLQIWDASLKCREITTPLQDRTSGKRIVPGF